VDFFTANGQFWLPQAPRRTVHGSLSFDEAGIQLELEGSLHLPAAPKNGIITSSPEWATEPVVHGRLRDRRGEVTLLQVSGFSMPGLDAETWSAAFALTGGLVTQDTFSQITVVLDYLMPWTRPPAMLDSSLTDPRITIDAEQKTLDMAKLDEGTTVRLITGAGGQRGDTAVHLDQWCAFQVTGKPKPLLEILDQWMRPLQDLLVVCLGQPVRIEEVLVRPPAQGPREAALNVAFRSVQPPRGRQLQHLDSYTAPTLLTYTASPLPFATLIKEWFRLCGRLPDAVTQFCGPYYAPFIYTRHRYASIFQSAEALAKATGETREKPRREHRQRVKTVMKALEDAKLDQKITRWVEGLIRRNDRPLAQLMEELITSTGEVGHQLLEAVPNAAGLAVATRTHVSHPGVKGPELLVQHRLGQALTWVIRVRLLAELGIPVGTLAAITIPKPPFQHDLQELATLQRPSPKAPRRRRDCAN
jgi:hypothetical protein